MVYVFMYVLVKLFTFQSIFTIVLRAIDFELKHTSSRAFKLTSRSYFFNLKLFLWATTAVKVWLIQYQEQRVTFWLETLEQPGVKTLSLQGGRCCIVPLKTAAPWILSRSLIEIFSCKIHYTKPKYALNKHYYDVGVE